MADATTQAAREAHWDSAYRDRGTEGVSWFQPAAAVSTDLLRGLGVPKDAAILDVGGGASSFVDALLAEGFGDLSVLDVSAVALEGLRRRVGTEAPLALIHADLFTWIPNRCFDVWHDRAVFHFLVDDDARHRYLDLLNRTLRRGGHLILGTFAADGPERCSGLPVARYSHDGLVELLGPEFEALEHRREEHFTPAGVMQPFIWLTARRRTESERFPLGSRAGST